MILLSGQTLTPGTYFTPESMSLNLSERDSTATMVLGLSPEIAVGKWLKDDTDPGKGIVWRVRSVDTDYNTKTQTVQLEHIIRTLADMVLPSDVTSKTMGGNAGGVTAKKAAQYVLKQQSVWTLGDFAFSVTQPYEFNADKLFDAMETICSVIDGCVWEYDLTKLPFRLHIRKESSTLSELRMDRNISSLKRSIDRSRMYTRIYPIGQNNLRLSGKGYLSKNESSYGIVCSVQTDQSLDTEAKLKAWAQARLNRHCEPSVSVTVNGLDLSASTGEALDKLVLGRVCRVPLPEFGTVIKEHIVKLAYRDKIRDPNSVTVTLANNQEDLASIIRRDKASSSKGGRAGAKKAGEDHAWFVDTEDHVGMVAEAVGGKGASKDWSRVSSIMVDGEGIHQRVTKTEGDMVTAQSRIEATEKAISLEVEDRESDVKGLKSQIKVEKDRISLVVKGTGENAKIKPAEIVASINAQTGKSTVKIDASKITIGTLSSKDLATWAKNADGLIAKKATIKDLEALSAKFEKLVTGTAKATLINVKDLAGDTVAGSVVYATSSLSIGSGGQGGSGTLYFQGSRMYKQSLTLGAAGSFISEGHFIGDSNTTLSLNHYHKIVAEEGSGSDAGKIIITLSDPVGTGDTTNSKTSFSIAATTAYKNGVLAARNAVKVQPFTANPVTGTLPSSRTFTYKTDAPTPGSGTSQEDSWHLAVGSWSNHKTTVGMHYGSAGGTTYARIEVDATDEYNDGYDAGHTAGVADGKNAVGISDPSWSGSTSSTDTRSVTVSTTGRGTNLSTIIGLTLNKSNNGLYVYLRQNGTNRMRITL